MEEGERVLAQGGARECAGAVPARSRDPVAHAQRALAGTTDWEAIALLYEGPLRCAPTIGARVAYARRARRDARRARRPGRASRRFRPMAVAAYQPYWGARGHLLKRGRHARRRPATRTIARSG